MYNTYQRFLQVSLHYYENLMKNSKRPPQYKNYRSKIAQSSSYEVFDKSKIFGKRSITDKKKNIYKAHAIVKLIHSVIRSEFKK